MRKSCNRIYRKAPTLETGWGLVLLLIVTFKKPMTKEKCLLNKGLFCYFLFPTPHLYSRVAIMQINFAVLQTVT